MFDPSDQISSEVIGTFLVVISVTCHEVLDRLPEKHRNIEQFRQTLRARLDEVCENRLADMPDEQAGLRLLVENVLKSIERRAENVDWHEKGRPVN